MALGRIAYAPYTSGMKPIYLIALALVASIALVIATTSPPALLNMLNAAWPGDDGVERVATAVPYGDAKGPQLDVWAPSAKSTEKRPVLIFFYGGGWAKGDRAAYGFAAKAFAAKGFIVVVPDYDKVPQVRFPIFVKQGAEAIKWTRDNIERFGGDPDRITLSGHSAGAHIAAMLTLDSHYLADIGVDPGIIRATVGLSGPYDFYPFDKKRSIDAMGQWPRPLETQPVTYARKDAPPMMLITGTDDVTVRPRNAQSLNRKLLGVGAPVKLVEYPGQGHEDIVMALSKPFRGKAPVLANSVAFLLANAQPRAKPPAQ